MEEKRKNTVVHGKIVGSELEIQLSGQIGELTEILGALVKVFAERTLHISEGEFYSGLVECYQELKEQEEQQKC